MTIGRKPAVGILVALALLIAVERLHSYDEPFERDVTGAAVIAHELMTGRQLYSDIWDHKPPALHVTHIVAQLVAGYGPGSIYLLGVAAAIVTLVGVYAAGAVAGRAAGLWAAAFWTVLSGDLWLQANQPNGEAFINASLAWAFALIVRHDTGRVGLLRWLAIGGLFGVASLYKQVALTSAVLLGCVHIASARGPSGRRRALAETAGAAAVTVALWGAVVAYFAAGGRLAEFRDAVFVFNRFYAGDMLDNFVRGLELGTLVPPFLRILVPLAVLTIAGVVLGVLTGTRRAALLLVAFLVGTFVAVCLPRFFHPHYYQLWLPPLVIGAGWAIGVFTERAGARYVRIPHVVAAALLLLLIAYRLPVYQFSAEEWSRIKYGSGIFVSSREIGREINTLLAPGETFYNWGSETGLYFASGRRPPTGVFYIYPLLGGPLMERLSARVLADLDRERPEMLVIANWALVRADVKHPVLTWLRQRYRPYPGDAERDQFVLLVRRGGRLEARLGPIE